MTILFLSARYTATSRPIFRSAFFTISGGRYIDGFPAALVILRMSFSLGLSVAILIRSLDRDAKATMSDVTRHHFKNHFDRS
jgi:predicted patatin/cPLA2 family phospholipase